MKRMALILNSFVLLSMLLMSACGKDTTTNTASSTSALSGGAECSCTSEEMPVCGINTSGNAISYLNICSANCYKATNIVQGHCVCSESLVCLSDGRTVTECDAQAYIRYNRSLTITKFQSCNSSRPSL